MPSAVSTPEQVINIALTRIGYKGRIGSIWEGSTASKKVLDIYAQTRDEMLRGFDWAFAERNAPMAILKQAPPGGYVPPLTWSTLYPPVPWQYEVQYPADCLKVRAVKNVPLFVPDYDPQPFQFSIDNDNALVPPAKVILCNVFPGVIVYTGQVTDPANWEPDFVEAFASSLGRRLAPVLMNLQTAQLSGQDEQQSVAVAENTRG